MMYQRVLQPDWPAFRDAGWMMHPACRYSVSCGCWVAWFERAGACRPHASLVWDNDEQLGRCWAHRKTETGALEAS